MHGREILQYIGILIEQRSEIGQVTLAVEESAEVLLGKDREIQRACRKSIRETHVADAITRDTDVVQRKEKLWR